MGLFRIQHNKFEEIFDTDHFDTMHPHEWEGEATNKGTNRLKEPGWEDRYNYEAALICNLIEENPHITNVLELGSGPGVLSQKILEKHPNLNYHLVDKPFAKKYFDQNNFKGEFFVKDLSCDFDTSDLLDEYDLVITNDFLEHVLNPSLIVQNIYKLTNPNSIYFISNPNWRMAHQWVYRGLFDFDNFVYFLYTHKFKLEGFYGSQLKTPKYPKIDSETLLPDDHLTDWNHYMLFKHRK
jgi:2-polyprenyl-3-methyl-5-hydroxy-6-metoxy-1,4-benzoquinol methylase